MLYLTCMDLGQVEAVSSVGVSVLGALRRFGS